MTVSLCSVLLNQIRLLCALASFWSDGGRCAERHGLRREVGAARHGDPARHAPARRRRLLRRDRGRRPRRADARSGHAGGHGRGPARRSRSRTRAPSCCRSPTGACSRWWAARPRIRGSAPRSSRCARGRRRRPCSRSCRRPRSSSWAASRARRAPATTAASRRSCPTTSSTSRRSTAAATPSPTASASRRTPSSRSSPRATSRPTSLGRVGRGVRLRRGRSPSSCPSSRRTWTSPPTRSSSRARRPASGTRRCRRMHGALLAATIANQGVMPDADAGRARRRRRRQHRWRCPSRPRAASSRPRRPARSAR